MSERYRVKVLLDGGPTLEIVQKAAIDAAKLQAIPTIISRCWPRALWPIRQPRVASCARALRDQFVYRELIPVASSHRRIPWQ